MSENKRKEDTQTHHKIVTHLLKWKWLYLSVFIMVLVEFVLFFNLKYLPGPLYGGDVYRERGFTEHIYQGYPFYEDPQMKGEVAYRPQFPYMLVALLAHLGLGSIDRIMIFFPLFVTAAYAVGIFLLSKQLFKNTTVAIMVMWLTYGIYFIYSPKHTLGLGFMSIIYSFYFLVRVIEHDMLSDKIAAGVAMGLVALSHLETFLSLAIVVMSVLLFEGLWRLFSGWKEFLSYLKEVFLKLWMPAAIGAAMSLVYVGPIFLSGKFAILNRVNEYAYTDINLMGMKDVFLEVKAVFFSLNGISAFLVSLIALVGLIYAVTKMKDIRYRAAIFIFCGVFIASAHFLITRPLFHFWITPGHIFTSFTYVELIFLMIGLMVIFSLSKKFKIIAVLCILALSLFMLSGNIRSVLESQWSKPYFSDQPWLDEMFSMRTWVLQNTQKYDVFLSNDESAFAVNALTARKFVMMRRIHTSQYVDINKRYADGFVILYGKDPEKVKQLLKQYGVKYLYMDQYLLSQPMLTDSIYATYLSEQGVNYTLADARWDPSAADARTLPSAIVYPQNITLIGLPGVKEVYRNSQSIIFELPTV